MKNRIFYINNTPPRLPIYLSILSFFLCKYYNAPEWVYGAAGLALLILWVVCLYATYKAEKVDLWDVFAQQKGISREEFIKELGKIKDKKDA